MTKKRDRDDEEAKFDAEEAAFEAQAKIEEGETAYNPVELLIPENPPRALQDELVRMFLVARDLWGMHRQQMYDVALTVIGKVAHGSLEEDPAHRAKRERLAEHQATQVRQARS